MKRYDEENIDFSDHDRIEELYDNYNEKCDQNGWIGFLGTYSKSELMSCYHLEKPVTMLEVVAATEYIDDLAEQLKEYFYICVIQGSGIDSEDGNYHQLYISRFRSLIDVAENFLDETVDNRADLAGIMFGYEPNDVAGYCKEQSDNLFK